MISSSISFLVQNIQLRPSERGLKIPSGSSSFELPSPLLHFADDARFPYHATFTLIRNRCIVRALRMADFVELRANGGDIMLLI